MAGTGKNSAMYATICRQPEDMRRVLAEGRAEAAIVGDAIAHAPHTYIVGIGTSYHAALAGQWMLRAFGVPVQAVSSYDFACYPEVYPLAADDVVLVLSHSGAKQYSLAAIERASSIRVAVFSIGGRNAEHPGSGFILRTTERERSAAFTSSHLTAMTVLAQVAVGAAESLAHKRAETFADAVDRLPDQVAGIIKREDDMLAIAQLCLGKQSYVVGAGPSEVSALEAVIKCREAAYARVDGMALEQFIHGPMICLQPDDIVLLIQVEGSSNNRNRDARTLFEALGPTLVVVGEGSSEVSFVTPHAEETLSPILTTVPMQLLAWHLATLQGLDPDTFRTQEPRFGAAIKALTL